MLRQCGTVSQIYCINISKTALCKTNQGGKFGLFKVYWLFFLCAYLTGWCAAMIIWYNNFQAKNTLKYSIYALSVTLLSAQF